MPTVTALRARGVRVAVELDGRPWRVVPGVAVLEAGLTVGHPLEREQARTLARALRRARADDVAVRALARRERSRTELDRRLARAGVRHDDREATLERAAQAGLVDDARFAETRARLLAERGAGDLLVLEDLERHGVDETLAREAVSLLDPEPGRAARIVDARGRTQRTLRYLASRGFAEESLEDLVADIENGALP
ncbi:MAG TPA: regulatory protein RecX [Gaiella sp.]|jgi:SOS response regulatory protein OraA/RecX